MKQIRAIRISFIICATVAVVAYWAGYYFGNNSTDPVDLVTENTTDIYREENAGAGSLTAERYSEDTGTDADEEADTVESMTDVSPETYYLKKNGSYLAVYQGDSDEVYFDTGIRFDELPDALQQDAAGDGIAFEDLEDVFGFLENYSS